VQDTQHAHEVARQVIDRDVIPVRYQFADAGNATKSTEAGMVEQERSLEFATEAQERAYWETHDSTDHLDWSKARKATLPNLKPTTRTISLRLPQHLLDSIKVAANARDVPYQSLIKVWLQEKLHLIRS
jgi:predicted DNA binding CopG/RHH family protein